MKIAILLPASADLGWRWRARALAMALLKTPTPDGKSIEVAVGLPRTDEATWRRQEAEIRADAPGVIVRHLGWESVPSDMALRMFPHCRADLDLIENCVVPRDWGWNFVDCDAWIICSDRSLGAVLPVRPTAYYVRDLAERYVPEASAQDVHAAFWKNQGHAFRLMRQSRVVFASMAATRDDVSGYGGVRRDRIISCPQLEPDPVAHSRRGSGKVLAWLVEPDARHDLTSALDGLRMYQADGGDMEIVACGEAAYAFDPIEGQAALTSVPTRSRLPTSRMRFETVSGEREVGRVLANSDFVWSSAVADGESEGLLRAAAANVPFVGLRYPQSEALADALGVQAIWYNRSEPLQIAEALSRLEAVRTPRPRSPRAAPRDDWSNVVERLWEAPRG